MIFTTVFRENTVKKTSISKVFCPLASWFGDFRASVPDFMCAQTPSCKQVTFGKLTLKPAYKQEKNYPPFP